jgi:hypothetical protein
VLQANGGARAGTEGGCRGGSSRSEPARVVNLDDQLKGARHRHGIQGGDWQTGTQEPHGALAVGRPCHQPWQEWTGGSWEWQQQAPGRPSEAPRPRGLPEGWERAGWRGSGKGEEGRGWQHSPLATDWGIAVGAPLGTENDFAELSVRGREGNEGMGEWGEERAMSGEWEQGALGLDGIRGPVVGAGGHSGAAGWRGQVVWRLAGTG